MSRHPHTAAARKVCRLALHGTPGSDPVHREPLSGPAGIPAADPRNARGRLKQCGRAGINHTTATHPIHLTNHTGIRHHNRNIRSSCCAARIFWA